jgi:hypothetical protein
MQHFSTSTSLPDSIRFEVRGRDYIVRVDQISDKISGFHVSIAEGWPSTPLGSKGYLYIASGQIPSYYWPPTYENEKLSGNIYCYSEYEFI